METLAKAKTIVRSARHWRDLRKYFPVLLCAFAFLLRLGLILVLKTYNSPYHFSEHVTVARHILEGRGYSHDWYGLGSAGEGSFMPPMYVAIVLIAKIVFPSVPWLAIQIFQAVLSTCTTVIVYFIGKGVFDEVVAVLASLLIAVYPPTLGYVLDIQTLTLETFLVASTVLACICWKKCATWKRASALGFALGLTVLSRSNLVLLLPLLLVWMVLCHGRRGGTHFAAVAGVCVLIVGPWVLRNYLVHRDWVFVSTEALCL